MTSSVVGNERGDMAAGAGDSNVVSDVAGAFALRPDFEPLAIGVT